MSEVRKSHENDHDTNVTKGEAVCFTAGPRGAPFGAGTIHAWLASDRPAPKVVAGISMGSVTAAAMQRCLQELQDAKAGKVRRPVGAARWAWFEHYLTELSDRPWDVFWKSFPDPLDFFAQTEPVKDLSCPDILKPDEEAAREHFWCLTKLGVWIAGLRVSVADVAGLVIAYVRRAEQIPLPVFGCTPVARLWRSFMFSFALTWICVKVLHAIVWKRLLPWWIVLVAIGIVVPLVYLTLFLAPTAMFVFLLCRTKPFRKVLKEVAERIEDSPEAGPVVRPKAPGWVHNWLLMPFMRSAGIAESLLHNYQFKRRIWNVFYDRLGRHSQLIVDDQSEFAPRLLIVAAALQGIKRSNQQIWAQPGTPLVEALASAVALPTLAAPLHVKGKDRFNWFPDNFERRKKKLQPQIDVMDGSVLRNNPLPALFSWLRAPENASVAKSLESMSVEQARVHVVFSVPIEPFNPHPDKPDPDHVDIVDAANAAILMRSQRDTTLEVQQTNYMSTLQVELARSGAQPKRDAPKLFPIFASQIAPDRELQFGNELAPTRKEFLSGVALGCRRSLEVLYRGKIQDLLARSGAGEKIDCNVFLQTLASEQGRDLSQARGVEMVCTRCTGELRYQPTPSDIPKGVLQTYGGGGKKGLRYYVPNLCVLKKADGGIQWHPKVVFVASGGVFRGAFHIGLIGAMLAAKIKPDLVVGASVGTLMGGALAAISNSSQKQGLSLLAHLTSTFLHVDERVALTVPLKTAVKQLGIRGSTVKLSPERLRSVVRAGVARNPGYAATGVPPELIDAMSRLFDIPPRETMDIASQFLAGSYAEAGNMLQQRLRTRTLRQFDIQYAVMGDSLLESAARQLMGGGDFDFTRFQPYIEGDRGTAFFSTTSYVNCRASLVLGRDSLFDRPESYSFLHAALSSSAFPAAFSVRREAEVFPGQGRSNVFFSDGGMFDNLPFFPALHVLSDTQVASRSSYNELNRPALSACEFLRQRLDAPNLILAGAFDARPSNSPDAVYETLPAIAKRVSELSASVKTDSFQATAGLVNAGLNDLANSYAGKTVPKDVERFMDISVVANVLNIAPTSTEHINPTFAFARSVGMRYERVAASIADGCFQTFRLVEDAHATGSPPVRETLTRLNIKINLRPVDKYPDHICPYFRMDGQDFKCPFTRASRSATGADREMEARDNETVYRMCKNDPTHKKFVEIVRKHR